METLDKEQWLDLAEDENKYFANAFLLVSTCGGDVTYSTPDDKQTYTEKFEWMIHGSDEVDVLSAEEALTKYIADNKDY